MAYKVLPPNESALRSNLKKYDVNGDNCLDKKELQEIFQYLGSKFPGWRAGRGFSHADSNGDGLISGKEIYDLIKYAKKKGFTLN